MNRKIAVIIIIIFTLIATAICITLFYVPKNKLSEKQKLHLDIKDIEGRFLNNDLIANKGVILVFFNTQCDLCLTEIPLLKANINRIEKQYYLIFISFEPKKSLFSFFLEHDINSSTNTYIISDEKASLLNTYNIEGYPSFLVFNKLGLEIKRGSAINERLLTELLGDEY